MEIIKDIKILDIYNDIRKSPRNYGNMYQDIIDLYPDQIKEIIKKDMFLQPRHVSQDIIKQMLIDKCLNLEPAFNVDKNCEGVINSICLYLRHDPAFLSIAEGYGFDKGLLLRGTVGSGKTILMRAVSNLLKEFNYTDYSSRTSINVGFTFIESWKISEEFTKIGFELFTSSDSSFCGLDKKSICIDDIGSEQIATHYGNTVNVIGSLLMDRYSLLQLDKDGNIKTHATSNLDLKTLKLFYGDRVFSRMKELFNDMILPGTDRRN